MAVAKAAAAKAKTMKDGEVVWAKMKGQPYWPAMMFRSKAAAEATVHSKLGFPDEKKINLATHRLMYFLHSNNCSEVALEFVREYAPHLATYAHQNIKSKTVERNLRLAVKDGCTLTGKLGLLPKWGSSGGGGTGGAPKAAKSTSPRTAAAQGADASSAAVSASPTKASRAKKKEPATGRASPRLSGTANAATADAATAAATAAIARGNTRCKKAASPRSARADTDGGGASKRHRVGSEEDTEEEAGEGGADQAAAAAASSGSKASKKKSSRGSPAAAQGQTHAAAAAALQTTPSATATAKAGAAAAPSISPEMGGGSYASSASSASSSSSSRSLSPAAAAAAAAAAGTPPAGHYPAVSPLTDDEYFMSLAIQSGARAASPRLRAGACIVGQEGTPLAMGHCKLLDGHALDDDEEEEEQIASQHGGSAAAAAAAMAAAAQARASPGVVPAEIDAVAQLPRGMDTASALRGARVFAQWFPSAEAAKFLAFHGVREVVFAAEQPAGPADARCLAKELFAKAQVKCTAFGGMATLREAFCAAT
jgi:deoxycytidylate deaminase